MAITLGKYTEAVKLITAALASDLKTYGEGHPVVAIYRNNLGEAWKALGEYKKAIEYYELALSTFNRVLGTEHPTTKIVLDNLNAAKTKMAQTNK